MLEGQSALKPPSRPHVDGIEGHVMHVLDADPDDVSDQHDSGGPLKPGVSNLGLLAIMGGFLAIICVASSRFKVPEPGVNW